MIRKSTALITVLVMLCFACNNNSDFESVEELKQDIASTDIQVAYDSTADFKTGDTLQQSQPIGGSSEKDVRPKRIDWDKKIVKNATLSAEVKDYKSFSQQLREKVKKLGGYVSQEEQSESEYQIQNSVIIKVPADQFENAINEFTKNISKLSAKHISSEDVTTQLVDGKSRLEAKKQVRLRYLELLKQAKNMEEILTVQKEINGIQEDIELVNGRINTLSHESAMSTIRFTFFQIVNPSAKIADEQKPGFLDKVKTSFANGWYWIGEVVIGLLSIWPLLVLIILGTWFFRRKQMPKIKANSNAS